MPVRLLNWIESKSLSFHLALALALALAARLLTAYFSYGPLAMDDYLDAVAPAIQWAAGKSAGVSPGRSYLLVWFLGGIVKIGHFFGVQSEAVSQIRFAYAGLGVFSLLTLLGGFLYAKVFADKVFAALLLYLLAFHAFMPLGSTRAFGEAVSMTWVMLGLGLAEWAKYRHRHFFFFVAMGLLGVGALFRYQSGLLFLAYLGWLVFEKRYRLLVLGLVAGIFIFSAEVGIDLVRNRQPLETFLVYLKRNEGSAAVYGVQPWYVFIAVLLACTYFPFSLALRRGISLTLKRHGAIVVCFGVFVVAHTLILHKEERFLFPIVPLFLILLASAWANVREARAARLVYFPAFLFFNSIFLSLVMFSNSQASLIEPVVRAQKEFDTGIFLESNTNLDSTYLARNVFLRKDFVFRRTALTELTPGKVDEVLRALPKRPMVMVLAAEEPNEQNYLEELAGKRTRLAQCGKLKAAASLTDRILFKLNPKYNTRRRPSYYVICRRV